MNNINVRPPIVISDVDKSQLSRIARSAASRLPDIADELMAELERAEICKSGRLPLGVVRMHSLVRFTTDRGSEHSVMLVYPEEADIIRDRLSILSPIGTALIGLSEGQVMYWTDRNGQSRWLKVIEVDNEPRERLTRMPARVGWSKAGVRTYRGLMLYESEYKKLSHHATLGR